MHGTKSHAMEATASHDDESGTLSAGPTGHHHRKAPFDQLNPLAQDVEDLVDAAVASFWGQDPAVYEEALAPIRATLEDWESDWHREPYMVRIPRKLEVLACQAKLASRPGAAPSAEQSLTKRLQKGLIDLLCNVFFLKESSQIVFKWYESIATHGKPLLGATGLDSKTGEVLIKMNPKARPGTYDKLGRKAFMISTLLHELCHAFLISWACENYCGKQKCRSRKIRLFGMEGHGKAWFLLASYVETAARQLFPQLELRLGISADVHEDLRAGGGIPGWPEYKRLSLSLSQQEFADLLSDRPGERWDDLDWEARLRETESLDLVSLAWLNRWREKQSIRVADGESRGVERGRTREVKLAQHTNAFGISSTMPRCGNAPLSPPSAR